jgi:hypothetical protein
VRHNCIFFEVALRTVASTLSKRCVYGFRGLVLHLPIMKSGLAVVLLSSPGIDEDHKHADDDEGRGNS